MREGWRKSEMREGGVREKNEERERRRELKLREHINEGRMKGESRGVKYNGGDGDEIITQVHIKRVL